MILLKTVKRSCMRLGGEKDSSSSSSFRRWTCPPPTNDVNGETLRAKKKAAVPTHRMDNHATSITTTRWL